MPQQVPRTLESLPADGQRERVEDSEAYGAVLRTLRCRAGFTQGGLSARSVVSRSTIQNLELGVVLIPRDATHQLLLYALAPFIGAEAQTELVEAYRNAKRQAFRREAEANAKRSVSSEVNEVGALSLAMAHGSQSREKENGSREESR